MTVQCMLSGKSKPGSCIQHVTWNMVKHAMWEMQKLSSTGVCYVAGVSLWSGPDVSKLWHATHMQLFRTVNAAHRKIFGRLSLKSGYL